MLGAISVVEADLLSDGEYTMSRCVCLAYGPVDVCKHACSVRNERAGSGGGMRAQRSHSLRSVRKRRLSFMR